MPCWVRARACFVRRYCNRIDPPRHLSTDETMEEPRTAPALADTAAPDRLDPEAFAALFVGSHNRFWLVAAAITGDRSHADDVVQEAALIALGKLDQFVKGTSFKAWMSEIVRLTALNFARKVRNRDTTPTDPVAIDRSHPSSAIVRRDEHFTWQSAGALKEYQVDFDDDVIGALHQVSEAARACLLLRVVEDLSYAEISEILDIPEGTAMSHVHRTKRVLREQLENRYTKGWCDREAPS